MTIPCRMTVYIALAAGTAVGLTLGWMLWRPAPVRLEPPAPAIRQMDDSLVLERKPEPRPAVPHQLPRGAKLERQIQVTVQPSAAAMAPTPGSSPEAQAVPAAATPCPPVTIDLSLVQLPDKTRRVIVSSPDGRVLETSVDIPVEAASAPDDTRNTLITSYNLYSRDATLGYSRRILNLGRLKVEAGALGIWQDRKVSAQILLVARWR